MFGVRRDGKQRGLWQQLAPKATKGINYVGKNPPPHSGNVMRTVDDPYQKSRTKQKWASPLNPIREEHKQTEANLPPNQMSEQRSLHFQRLKEEAMAIEDPAGRSAALSSIYAAENRELESVIDGNIQHEALIDFRNFLAGQGKATDYAKLGWWPTDKKGKPTAAKPRWMQLGTPISQDNSVYDYLSGYVRAKNEFETDIASLMLQANAQGPGSLSVDQLWLLWKYVVQGMDPTDIIQQEYADKYFKTYQDKVDAYNRVEKNKPSPDAFTQEYVDERNPDKKDDDTTDGAEDDIMIDGNTEFRANVKSMNKAMEEFVARINMLALGTGVPPTDFDLPQAGGGNSIEGSRSSGMPDSDIVTRSEGLTESSIDRGSSSIASDASKVPSIGSDSTIEYGERSAASEATSTEAAGDLVEGAEMGSGVGEAAVAAEGASDAAEWLGGQVSEGSQMESAEHASGTSESTETASSESNESTRSSTKETVDAQTEEESTDVVDSGNDANLSSVPLELSDKSKVPRELRRDVHLPGAKKYALKTHEPDYYQYYTPAALEEVRKNQPQKTGIEYMSAERPGYSQKTEIQYLEGHPLSSTGEYKEAQYQQLLKEDAMAAEREQRKEKPPEKKTERKEAKKKVGFEFGEEKETTEERNRRIEKEEDEQRQNKGKGRLADVKVRPVEDAREDVIKHLRSRGVSEKDIAKFMSDDNRIGDASTFDSFYITYRPVAHSHPSFASQKGVPQGLRRGCEIFGVETRVCQKTHFVTRKHGEINKPRRRTDFKTGNRIWKNSGRDGNTRYWCRDNLHIGGCCSLRV